MVVARTRTNRAIAPATMRDIGVMAGVGLREPIRRAWSMWTSRNPAALSSRAMALILHRLRFPLFIARSNGRSRSLRRADALAMAEDIGSAQCVEERLEDLAEPFPGPVYVMLGNHDFYGSSVAAVRERIRALAAHTPNLDYSGTRRKTAMVGVDGWAEGTGTGAAPTSP